MVGYVSSWLDLGVILIGGNSGVGWGQVISEKPSLLVVPVSTDPDATFSLDGDSGGIVAGYLKDGSQRLILMGVLIGCPAEHKQISVVSCIFTVFASYFF